MINLCSVSKQHFADWIKLLQGQKGPFYLIYEYVSKCTHVLCISYIKYENGSSCVPVQLRYNILSNLRFGSRVGLPLEYFFYPEAKLIPLYFLLVDY